MKIEKRDAAHEKRILVGMIVDNSVLARIAPKWVQGGLFRSKYANLIAGWAIKHHLKFGASPGKMIESHFERWADKNRDEETFNLVESFLEHLSNVHESQDQPASECLIDLAAAHFNRVKKERFLIALQGDLDVGDDAAADQRFIEYSRLELGVGAGIDIFHDKEAIKAAFTNSIEPLIQYPKGLKYFFGNALSRDSLVCYLGAPGKGKSWWLIDGAYRGMRQKRRTAFFTIGDMSQDQIVRRFCIRASRRPLEAGAYEFPEDLVCERGKKRAKVTTKTVSYGKPLSWEMAWDAGQKVIGKLDSETPMLRISCHPNNSVSIHDIAGILEGWDRQGWTPDIIYIDYADLLRPLATRGDKWEQVDETWKALRAMSQSRHCLLMTATQANMDGIKADTLQLHNVAFRVITAAATSIFGINMTAREQSEHVCRLNILKTREQDFDSSKPVHVASCLAIANPGVLSVFER